ncbi:DUF3164 family protein [Apibacter muscae]|uniref:DUF3164 family protein n=1 Tax=Apibacter muscae TaxID=2509004 RepID=UPI0011AD1355|nr:DUF3164 family protein [Apibacter muscae]TWP23503.1 DUF3164 family protein [Apibacter muscae]
MKPVVDLTQLSEKELAEALKAKRATKEADRKAYKSLVHETIPSIITNLIRTSSELQNSKTKTFEALRNLIELKYNIYGVKDEQQSHTFTTEKGESVTIGYNVNDNWDDTVNSGIAKINEYIKSLAEKEAEADTITIINQLLKRDNKGNLKSSRVLELISLADKLNNETFADGVKIIQQAYKPERSSFFIKASYINNLGKKMDIALSISTVDFPKEFDLSFLLPSKDINHEK